MVQQKVHQLLMLFLFSCAAIALALLVIEPILGILWILLIALALVILALCKPAIWQAEKAWLEQLKCRIVGRLAGEQAKGVLPQRYELLVLRPQQGQRFEICGKNFLIGRSAGCNCRLSQSASVGREHCRIVYREHSREFYIEDLRSKNGTYLGTRRLEPNTQVKLLENAEIVIGEYCLRFQKKM